MQAWVLAANDWSVAAQAVVETSTALATHSRELADRLSVSTRETGDGVVTLTGDLRMLADGVEADSLELRNRYLATAANIDDFKDFVD